jgi:hypothetical protein
MRFEHAVLGRLKVTVLAVILAAGGLALAGCATKPPPVQATAKAPSTGGGFHLFGPKAPRVAPDNGTQIGVNSYLWRASLDVVKFMGLTSADPYGGLIVTDWYVNPEKTDERFKASVDILDTRLRADGIHVSINRQVKGADGQWVNATTSPQTETSFEDQILAKARSLRIGAD